MKSNEVFDKISCDKDQNIKQFIKEKFKINQKQPSSNSIADLFEIKTKEEKITFTLYKINKLMFQSSHNNQDFINLIRYQKDTTFFNDLNYHYLLKMAFLMS